MGLFAYLVSGRSLTIEPCREPVLRCRDRPCVENIKRGCG